MSGEVDADLGLLGDERITTVGLLFEAAAALERLLDEDLRRQAGMPLATFEILIRLGRSPRCRLPHYELSRQLSLSSGGVTRIVDRLEKAGLVFRERDACDKRIYYVTLAESGRAALDAALPVHVATVERLLVNAVGNEGLAALEAAVRPLRDNLVGEPRSAAES